MQSKIPVRGSTQEALPIEEIKENLVLLTDGSACMIIQVTALNFGLLSEQEQDATIYSYAALLNSLTFSIQILIRSRRKDVTGYLDLLASAQAQQTNPLLCEQIKKYRRFVEEIVKKNNVLDKKFYLVIPFSALELGAKKALGAALTPQKKALPFPKKYLFEQAKINLSPKRDHLARQFSRLGLTARQLSTQELISLFYEIYNPAVSESQKPAAGAEYTSALVQPALKI